MVEVDFTIILRLFVLFIALFTIIKKRHKWLLLSISVFILSVASQAVRDIDIVNTSRSLLVTLSFGLLAISIVNEVK